MLGRAANAASRWPAFVAHHSWLDETGPAESSHVLLLLAASQFAVLTSQLVLVAYSLQWSPFAGLGVGSLGAMLLISSSCERGGFGFADQREGKGASSSFVPPPRKPTLWELLSTIRAPPKQ